VRAALRAGLVDILRRAGVTAVMVSHDQEEAFDMADDVVILHRGAPLAQGAPAALAADPGSPFVMDFVHEANRLPAASLLPRAMGFATAAHAVLLAPCHVEARAAPPRGAPSVLATVVDASFAGDVRKYELRLADGSVVRAHVPTRGDDGATTEGGGALLEVGGKAHVWAAAERFMGYREEDLMP
jgi:sulfate transport system ATP-binding protein